MMRSASAIGTTVARTRALHGYPPALGAAQTVVNVGAGAGSYEPTDRRGRRGTLAGHDPAAAPRERARRAGVRHGLTVRAAAFEAGLAILTVHHWPDPVQGLTEMARVTQRRIVIVTWDPATSDFWLIADYFPAIAEMIGTFCPALEVFRATFGAIEVHPLPVPHDCCDGFLGAYWRRPHAYWTLASAARYPRSPSSPMWTLVLPASAAILRAERGNVAMGLSCIQSAYDSATVWVIAHRVDSGIEGCVP